MGTSRFFAILGAIFASAFGLMTTMGPDAAEANLCGWIRLIVPEAPVACLRGVPAEWLQIAAILIAAVCIAWAFSGPIQRAIRSGAPPQRVAVAAPDARRIEEVAIKKRPPPPPRPPAQLTIPHPWSLEQLARVIIRADDLMAASIRAAPEFAAWKRLVRTWYVDAEKAVMRVSATDLVRFRDEISTPPAQRASGFTGSFNNEHCAYVLKLYRARQFIKELHSKHGTP